jgi:hypothetical protein
LNEGKVVGGELVIARRNPAAVLDLVEEALDQVPSAVEIQTEADRLGAVASWPDVGPCTLLGRKAPDPVRIITTIGQQHRFRLQSRQEFASKSVVVRLAGRQREPHRQAIGIHQCMNLAGQSTSRAPH